MGRFGGLGDGLFELLAEEIEGGVGGGGIGEGGLRDVDGEAFDLLGGVLIGGFVDEGGGCG